MTDADSPVLDASLLDELTASVGGDRAFVTDLRLPWEKPLPTEQLTPGRVRRCFRSIHAQLGTPASGPKPCGSSPGRPRGTTRGPAPRHPAIKITGPTA